MLVFISVVVVMLAFAGNSVFTWLAQSEIVLGVGSFVLLPLVSGALFLLLLTARQKRLKDLLGANWLGGMLAVSLYLLRIRTH